jgi:hypothetical protein
MCTLILNVSHLSVVDVLSLLHVMHEEWQDIWRSEIRFSNPFSISVVRILFLSLSENRCPLTSTALLHISTELEYVKAHSAYRSQDSSVIIVTGYGLDGWGSGSGRGSVPSSP